MKRAFRRPLDRTFRQASIFRFLMLATACALSTGCVTERLELVFKPTARRSDSEIVTERILEVLQRELQASGYGFAVEHWETSIAGVRFSTALRYSRPQAGVWRTLTGPDDEVALSGRYVSFLNHEANSFHLAERRLLALHYRSLGFSSFEVTTERFHNQPRPTMRYSESGHRATVGIDACRGPGR